MGPILLSFNEAGAEEEKRSRRDEKRRELNVNSILCKCFKYLRRKARAPVISPHQTHNTGHSPLIDRPPNRLLLLAFFLLFFTYKTDTYVQRDANKYSEKERRRSKKRKESNSLLLDKLCGVSFDKNLSALCSF